MAQALEKWLVSSNECININLTRPSKKTDKLQRIFDEPFTPDFTYPIFGDDQTIFGYSDLDLSLNFRANDLNPSLDIQYGEKWTPIGETRAMDLKEMLKDFLPDYALDRTKPSANIGPDPTSQAWTPPGKPIHKYTLHGKHFEIWSANLSDPVAKELFRRMQILVTFFIEGGTPLTLDDPDIDSGRWTLFLLYEVTPLKRYPDTSPYTFVGFANSYRYWIFPSLEILRATKLLPSPPTSDGGTEGFTPPRIPTDPETYRYTDQYNPLEAQSRERISQFIILTPCRGQSHGTRLYETIFKLFIDTPNIFQIAVELPSEAFDDMRDWADIAYLRKLPLFQSLALPSTLPPEKLAKNASIPRDLIIAPDSTLTALRHQSKIVPRQLIRVIELHLFSTIPAMHRSKARITRKEKSSNENDRKYYFWRLALKDRLYRHNLDLLAQLAEEERIQKIEDTAVSVQMEYERLLEGLEKRAKWAQVEEDGAEKGSGERAKRKRRVVDEEDEDEYDDEMDGQMAGKKPKTGT